MKKRNDQIGRVAALCSALVFCFATTTRAAGPDLASTDHGKIRNVNGIRVMRVTGGPRDRGHAHGYLLARDILDLIDGFLAAEKISGGPRQFEALSRNLDHIMEIPSPYLVELDGMLAGIEKRLDGETTIPKLGRKLTRNDLVAMNCIPDSIGFGCSSFAAWGKGTTDGNTIAGRNLDWHAIDSLKTSQIVVAYVPEAGSSEAAWISVTWPGMTVCLTGMNEHGVTVSMHDAFVGTTKNAVGLTPRGFALRAAIESARPEHVEADVLGVLSRLRVLVGNIVPVASPRQGDSVPSLVFEYDGARKNSRGVTVRHPAKDDAETPDGRASAEFQVATNHFRERRKSERCGRYSQLANGLSKIDGKSELTIEGAWELLKRVSMGDGGLVTYHSVVFEPNAMRMHVSYSTEQESAPNGRRGTLKVDKILRRRAKIAAAGG